MRGYGHTNNGALQLHEVECLNVMLGHNAQTSYGVVHGCSGTEIREPTREVRT